MAGECRATRHSPAIARETGAFPASTYVLAGVDGSPESTAAARWAAAEAAFDAELLVLGSRGLGGFAGLLVGSVGLAVAGWCEVSAIFVRAGESERPGGPDRPEVVVGVDTRGPSPGVGPPPPPRGERSVRPAPGPCTGFRNGTSRGRSHPSRAPRPPRGCDEAPVEAVRPRFARHAPNSIAPKAVREQCPLPCGFARRC
ncbi:universal stress protein [Kitasatospora sp. NPDC001660]